MAVRAEFTDLEWSQLLEGVFAVPVAMVMTTGMQRFLKIAREVIAAARGTHRIAKEQFPHSPLIQALTSNRQDALNLDGTPPTVDEALQLVREALAIIERVTPDEVYHYKHYIVAVAEHVAQAVRDDDGTPISPEEQAIVDQLRVELAL